jgi:hypothetical protein
MPSAVNPRFHVDPGVAIFLMSALFALGLLGMAYVFPARPVEAANFTVTNLDDSGAGSLRQAIDDVNTSGDADNVIEFDLGGMLPGTITLTSGQLQITNNVDIQGPGADQLTVNGNSAGRVFAITDGSTVEISGLTIADGRTLIAGGVLNSLSDLTLVNVVVIGNAAEVGGGIANSFGTLTVIDSSVTGNAATFFGLGPVLGGGIVNDGGTLVVRGSTVSDNTAIDAGGGIFSTGGSASLTNSTVSGNSTTDEGGGIYNSAGTVNLINSTVANNTAAAGGGIFDFDCCTVNLTNTIVADNTPSDCGGNPPNFVSGGFNLDSDDTCELDAGGDLGPGTANLGPLQDNGGPTETHQLLSGSDAINGGDSSVCADESAPFDQRGDGFNRIEDSRCDIGAFEVQVAPPVTPAPTQEFVPDPATPTPTRTPTPVATTVPVATQPSGQVGAISPPATGDAGLQ